MKFIVCTIGLMVFLSVLSQPIYADMPQKNSLEITKEKLLQSYRLSNAQTAHLFSAIVVLKSTRQDGRQGQMKYKRFYVDIEQETTKQRRRIWQYDFVFIPQITPESFVFGKTGKGQLCLGLASDFRTFSRVLYADRAFLKKGEGNSFHTPIGHS